MYLEMKNVSKTIGKTQVLTNITLGMERGRIYGLRGKNGSGKTMLMRAVCGLIRPTEGSISIDGEILGKDISFPRSIGALIESPGFMHGYSGYKNLETLASIRGVISGQEIEERMTELGLEPSDPKKFKKYSLGMKQKLGIIAATMENPDIIVLDEPINALDEKSVEAVKRLVLRHRGRGALILISCHDRDELEFLSDEIFCMENGTVCGHYLVEDVNGRTPETEEQGEMQKTRNPYAKIQAEETHHET